MVEAEMAAWETTSARWWLGGLLDRFLDAACGESIEVAEGPIGGRSLLVVACRPRSDRGAIGLGESDRLRAAVRECRSSGKPLALFVDSSGVRVSDGIEAVAALRRLLRDLFDLRIQGRRVLALVSNQAFGGASLLSSACEVLLAAPDARLAVSGPRLIAWPEQVTAAGEGARLISAAQRRARGEAIRVVAPDFDHIHEELSRWLASPEPGLLTAQRLEAILQGLPAGPARLPTAKERELARVRLAARVPLRHLAGNVYAREDKGGFGLEVAAVCSSAGLTAADCAALAAWLLQRRGSSTIKLYVDCESHSGEWADEELQLGRQLVALGLVLRLLHWSGTAVDVVVVGSSGGASHAVLGAGATRVLMDRQARIAVLPAAALKALRKSEEDARCPAPLAVQSGAADALIHLELPA